MEQYAAIEVWLEWSSVCVVDAAGQILREAKVQSERETLVAFSNGGAVAVAERGLVETGLTSVRIETRQKRRSRR